MFLPALDLYVQPKCCRSHSDSVCWGSLVGVRSLEVEVEVVVVELPCLWWVKMSPQTKALRWDHCHHLEEKNSGKNIYVKFCDLKMIQE